MPEIGPEHPLTYRQEIAAQLFDLLRGGESGAVVGPASMGKSRLLQFLLRPDVQQHYLAEAAATTWLVLVDCNRLAEISEWGLYELMLTSLTEAPAGRLDPASRDWLNDLRRDAITGGSPLLARRHVELATRVLCREHGLRLCFILDEFDAAYRSLPPGALANLRALRDADRYGVCYVLMLRDHPERLRPPADCESFYELVSRSIIGLTPYVAEDARRVLEQLVARRRFQLSAVQIGTILDLSGGHPGLIVALFDAAARGDLPEDGNAGKALKQPQMAEECRKLWAGLGQDEQLALSRLAQGVGIGYAVRQLLSLKGLIKADGADAPRIFSPVLTEYVRTQGAPSEKGLWLDESATVAWVDGRPITDLTRLEFELLRLLYRRLDQVCSRDEILATLYPDETLDPQAGSPDNRVDSLVRHLRKAIEADTGHPRYLLTVRGRGYKLVDTPATAG